jgi:hypothetical protein
MFAAGKSVIVFAAGEIKRGISTLGLLLLMFLCAACEFHRESGPSVLVIAVENLSFDSFSCDADDLSPGFDVFCEEAVRFTHAFTPSTMSQSALASVLTASYPLRHGVHDNGSDHLSAKFKTVSEAAVQKGYRTAFFSGGPPILRKSGLAQGFELFDDNFDIAWGKYFRPVNEVTSLFMDWLSKDVGGSPFFSFLFVADLQFPDSQTFTHEGEIREKTVEAQLQEIGESLQNLVDVLKAKHRWDTTNVVLMGTSGGLVSSNLKSENTQVSLFIKPARTSRENGQGWAIDRNVSLVDLGQTLFAILGETTSAEDEPLEKVTLQSALTVPEPDWPDNRVIYSESGWTRWRLGQDVKFALRQKQFLYIKEQLNEKSPVVFNSLTDHIEEHPLSLKDPLWVSSKNDLVTVAEKINLALKPKPPALTSDDVETGRMMWEHRAFTEKLESDFATVVSHPEEDPLQTSWWARWALEKENWTALVDLGRAVHNPIWTFVGESRLGKPTTNLERNECLAIFKGLPSAPNCTDEGLLAVQHWTLEKNEEEKAAKRERVFRMFSTERIYDRIGQINYVNNAKWDVRLDRPKAPSLMELYLALPRNHTFSASLNGSLGAKDLGL